MFNEILNNSLYDIWDELKNSPNPIVLFGAGTKGRKVFQILQDKGIGISLFCDNNPKLQSEQCCGLEVISYENLRKRFLNYTLLITTSNNYVQAIQEQLKQAQESNPFYHCSVPFKVDDVFLDKQDLLKEAKSYQYLHEKFSDDISKDIFLKFLNSKVTGSSLDIIQHESGTTFFDDSLITSWQDHHYVDVGAFTGDTIMKFCQFCRGNYKKIDAFELDEKNRKKLHLFIKYSALNNVTVHDKGAWHEAAEISYYTLEGTFDDGFGNPNLFCDVAGSLDYDFKDEIARGEIIPIQKTCKVDSLDTILKNSAPTIIKINALAADLSVLQGCRNIAKTHRPTLIFDYGSRPSHILAVPQELERINPDYKLFLRQKMIFGDSKTVLYAI